MSVFVSARRSAQFLVLVSSRRRRNATVHVARIITPTHNNTIIDGACSSTTTCSATLSSWCPLISPSRIRLFSTTTNSRSLSLRVPLDVDVAVDDSDVNLDLEDSDLSLLIDNSDDDDEDEKEEDTTRYFANLEHLHHKTLNTLTQQGITSMTEIQARTYDAVIQGKDVVGRSRTGSGKTLAFLLPTLERIIQQGHTREDGEDGVRILVISPTRELATQIHTTAEGLVKPYQKVGASCQVMFGGTARGGDLILMDRRLPTILTATPGRLIDHLESSKLRDRGIHFADAVKNIDVLILDEMDRLLDMGFRDEIQKIVHYLPPKHRRQTLLFSATVPPTVQKQIQRFLAPNYKFIDCIQDDDPNSHVVNTVEQSYVVLPPTKLVTGVVQLIEKLMQHQSSNDGNGTSKKLMVFFNTTAQVEFYMNLFKKNGGTHRVMEIHSKISQNERSKTSQRFRKVSTGILFTSDVSARGVDYPNVTHVVQVGSATNRETYIHRLGRTGRAGKSGTGILVLNEQEVEPVLRRELTGIQIPANQELQDIINEATTPAWMTRALNYDDEDDDDDNSMKDRAIYCYQSLIGFYFLHFKNLGIRHHLETVVDMITAFADQAGLKEPPALRVKVAQQYGLLKHPKINVEPRSSGGGRGGRGDGRSRGGLGRGRDNGRSRGGRGRGRGRGRDWGTGLQDDRGGSGSGSGSGESRKPSDRGSGYYGSYDHESRNQKSTTTKSRLFTRWNN